jgi:hypothetical protein
MSIKIRKAYDDVMEGQLTVVSEEWRKEKGEPLRNGSPFSFLYSPVLFIKLIMARVLHHFNVSA